MKTNYVRPFGSTHYEFKLVDSSFIHAIHYAMWNHNVPYKLGVSLLSNPEHITWYNVHNPVGVYSKLTNPHNSPGFVFNNSVRGKPNTTFPQGFFPKQDDVTHIDNKPYLNHADRKDVYEHTVGTKESRKKVVEELTNSLNAWLNPNETNVSVREAASKRVMDALNTKELDEAVNSMKYNPTTDVHNEDTVNVVLKNVKTGSTVAVSSLKNVSANGLNASFKFGVLLDTCQKSSSIISYLALGFNQATKGFVIYYSIKNKPGLYTIVTDVANVYRNWCNAESLGRHFNKTIKKNHVSHLMSEYAQANR